MTMPETTQSDLVARLRGDGVVEVMDAAKEAAAEIEWLRKKESRLRAHCEALAGALEPFVEGFSHTMVFLSTREKMHVAGRDLYNEDVARADKALSAYRGENANG